MLRNTTELQEAFQARRRVIEARQPADPGRRARLERDPSAWLRHYMPGAFALSWSKGHRAMIAGAMRAAKAGTGVAVAAPRGEGKTTVLRGMCLYLVATGACRFPLLAGWTHRAASEGFRLWLRMLHASPEFGADYPEITQPFEQSTHAARVKSLIWSDTGKECGADVRSTERTIVLPDSLGAIAAASVQGDVKGLSVTLQDGSVIRPDLLLIDDAQDPKRADNPVFVADVVETIEKQWMCLAGPQSRITTMVACTVAAAGDVSEHFLSRPDFKAIRIPRVTSWPEGWDGETRKLWDAWHDTLMEGEKAGDGGVAGRKFYREHKAELTKGMMVSWAKRLDKKRKDPDALYSAMFDLYRIGPEAFASEYQNEPIRKSTATYELRAEDVMRHAVAMPRFTVPASTTILVGHCDINRTGLHFCVAGFDQSMTGHCPLYGVWPERGDLWPENAAELVRKQAIYRGLVDLFRMLAQTMFLRDGKPIRIGTMLVDRGYEPDVVHKFVSMASYPFRVIPARGYAAHKYWPRKAALVGRPMEGCHVTRSENGSFLAFNADMWRETAQRAFLGEPGMPGGFTLHEAKTPRQHEKFAEHVVAEQLTNKYDTAEGQRWEWHHQPRAKWDWGDALTGCWVAAAYAGLSPSGIQVVKRPQRRETRKCKVERTL